MSKFEIRCPHCDEVITMETHILRKDKGRGVKAKNLGKRVDNRIIKMIENGCSFREVAETLMGLGILTPNGHATWYPASVRRVYTQALIRRADAPR